jgi:hypothetical protein
VLKFNCTATAWGPVIHYDHKTGRVFVFYSLSRECGRPTTPKMWEPGGDVRVVVGEHLAVGLGLDTTTFHATLLLCVKTRCS